MMATQVKAVPAWHSFRVATFAGSRDSHKTTGEDYKSLSLASIFEMKPTDKPKMSGPAFLASSYCNYDARSHEAQRQNGSFVALVGDIDSGNLDLSVIQAAAETFADGAAWLIYSSAHARADDQRWRLIFPLDTPSPFADWYDGQVALFTFLESRGIPVDHAMSRAGQPIYLPNVPFNYKDGTPLRDEDGEPIYYQSAHSELSANGVSLAKGIVAGGISSIRQRRIADDREREALRKIAAAKHATRAKGEGGNIMHEFNETTSVETMLALCDYKQSPADGRDWRSPHQTGETYATRVFDQTWVSLSASDASTKLGRKSNSGCFGDAYDLFVHYKHGDDHTRAQRELYNEQRGANVVLGNFRGEADDPGWQEWPEWADTGEEEPEVDVEALEPSAKDAGDNSLGFNIIDWSMDRFAGSAPEIQWLCEGSIPLAVPALFAAMGGVGKSFMALDMALEIANEVIGGDGTRRILGGPIRAHGSVVVLGAEDGKDSVHRRLERIDPGGRREGANGRLFVVPLPETGGPMTLIGGSNGEFAQTAKLEGLIAQLAEIPDLKLIILDPLQAFITANITSDPAAGQFMWSAFARICAVTGATVIACHHMRKEGSSTIETSDQAREAIRGSTALIDGSRATYALWGASEDDSRRVCNEAGVQHQPKRVVHGAVVKSNDEHDWEIHTYIRGDNGLLVDANDAGKRAQQKSKSMTSEQAMNCLREIGERWNNGRPFSAAPNSQDRYIVAWMQRSYGITKYVAKGQLDDWFHAQILRSGIADKKTKLNGLEVVKWPG